MLGTHKAWVATRYLAVSRRLNLMRTLYPESDWRSR